MASEMYETCVQIPDEKYLDIADNFNKSLLHPTVIHRLLSYGFLIPTPLQSAAIPLALTGNDLMIISSVGTGKAVSLAILAANVAYQSEFDDSVLGVIICADSHEVSRISQYLEGFLGDEKKILTLIRDPTKGNNKPFTAKTYSLIVGLPSVIAKLAKKKCLELSGCKLFAFYLADKLMGASFHDDIEVISNSINIATTQVAAFASSMPPELLEYMNPWMKKPAFIHILKPAHDGNCEECPPIAPINTELVRPNCKYARNQTLQLQSKSLKEGEVIGETVGNSNDTILISKPSDSNSGDCPPLQPVDTELVIPPYKYTRSQMLELLSNSAAEINAFSKSIQNCDDTKCIFRASSIGN